MTPGSAAWRERGPLGEGGGDPARRQVGDLGHRARGVLAVADPAAGPDEVAAPGPADGEAEQLVARGDRHVGRPAVEGVAAARGRGRGLRGGQGPVLRDEVEHAVAPGAVRAAAVVEVERDDALGRGRPARRARSSRRPGASSCRRIQSGRVVAFLKPCSVTGTFASARRANTAKPCSICSSAAATTDSGAGITARRGAGRRRRPAARPHAAAAGAAAGAARPRRAAARAFGRAERFAIFAQPPSSIAIVASASRPMSWDFG